MPQFTGNITAVLDLYSAGFEAGLQKAAAQSKKFADDFSRSQLEAQKATGRFGSGAANLAQQVQDMAVQFQSGTAAVTIMAQQLPQAASALGQYGAIAGAAIGVTALLASKFLDLGQAIAEAPDPLGDLVDAMGDGSSQAKKLAEEIDRASGATLEFMAKAAEFSLDNLGAEIEKLSRRVTNTIREQSQQAADQAASNIGLASPIPFAIVQQARRQAEARAPEIQAGQQTATQVESQFEAAINAGKPDEIYKIAKRNDLFTEENFDSLRQMASAALRVMATRSAMQEINRKIAGGRTTPPPSERIGLPTLDEISAASGKPSRKERVQDDAEWELEAAKRLAQAAKTSQAEYKKTGEAIEAERKARAAGIKTKGEELDAFVKLQVETKRYQDAADNTQIIRQLTEERNARAALLKDAGKVTDASKEQEAAMEAVNALRRSGIDLSGEEGKQIEALTKQNAILNVRLDEQQKIEGKGDKGIAKREKKIETVDFEIQMTEKLIAAIRQSDQAYADAEIEVEALRAAHALGAEATEAERQAVYDNTKEREKANATLKEAIALMGVAAERQQLIAQGKLTPIRRDPAGVPLPNTPPVEPIVNTEEIDRALGLDKNAQEHAQTYTDAWKTALDDLQGVFTDVFEQLFSGQLNSAKEFADSLKSIMARAAANMVSGALFSGQGILGGGQAGGTAGGLASLGGMFGRPMPVADYRTMSQADAQRRMAMGPFATQAPWAQPGAAPGGFSWATMTEAQKARMLGMGGMGLATIGGMMGGAPGQFSPGGLMSTVGTGIMMGQGLGIGALGGGGALLAGSLMGRFAGGGLRGGLLGGVAGGAIGGLAYGGPFGALAGGLIGGLGGFLGGGNKPSNNRAGFSFNPLTGATRQDKSPGADDPNRQAALQLVKEMQQLTASLRGFGISFRPGTIQSSVSRTQTAEEALASLVKQIRELGVAPSRQMQRALRAPAAGPEELLQNVQFAQEWEVMIRLITPFQAKMRELNARFAEAAVKVRQLGFDEGALAKARERARQELFAQREAEANSIRGQLGIIGPFEAQMRELQEAFRQAGLRAAELGLNVANLAEAQRRAMQNLAHEREQAGNAVRAQMGMIDPEEAQIRQVDADVYRAVGQAVELGLDPEAIVEAGEKMKAEVRKQFADQAAERERQLKLEAAAIREQLGIIGPWEARIVNLNEAFAEAQRRADELGLSERELADARKRAFADLERQRIAEADAVKAQLGVFTPYEAKMRDIENAFANASARAEDYWVSEKELSDARTRAIADLEQQRRAEAAGVRAQLGIIGPFEAQLAELENAFYQASRNAKDLGLSEGELRAARTRAIADLEEARKTEAAQLRAQLGIIGPWAAQLQELELTFRQAFKNAKDLGIGEDELREARRRAIADLNHQRQVEATGVMAQTGIIGPWEAQFRELEEVFYQAAKNARELGIGEQELAAARVRAFADLRAQRRAEAVALRAQLGIIGEYAGQFRALEEVFRQAGLRAAELGIGETELNAARERALENLRAQRRAEASALRAQLGIIGEYAGQFRALEEVFRQAALRAADLGISEQELAAARARAIEDLRAQRRAEANALRGQLGIIGPYAAQFRALEETFRQAALRAADLGISEQELAAARQRAIADLRAQRRAEANALRGQLGIIGPYAAQFRALEETFRQAALRAADLGISEQELSAARARAIADLREQRRAESVALQAQLGIVGDYVGRFRALNEQFRQASLRAGDLGIDPGQIEAARQRALEDLRHQRRADRDAILAQTGIISPFEHEMRQLEEMFYQASRRAADLGINEEELNAARTRAIANLKKQREEQLRQAEEQLRSSGEQLRGFLDSLVSPLRQALSPQGIFQGILAPQAAANDNLNEFRRTLALARADDVEAIQNLPAAAQAAVESARQYGGSGPAFAKIFREIQEGLQSTLNVQEERRREIIDQTPEAIRRTGQMQIDAMREEFARLREQFEGLRRDLRLRAAA